MKINDLFAPRAAGLHFAILVIAVLCEMAGIVQIPIGIGTIILLPFLYAFLAAILLNPHINKATRKLLDPRGQKMAATMIGIAIMPFVTKFATTIGPKISDVLAAGPALLLQELGNIGTIFIALPVAIYILRMGREAVGATYSIDREPNLAIIQDKFGLNSPEGAGAMGVYAIGTLLGTFIFAIIPVFVLHLGLFDVRALAMACGVGSGSMLAACTGALASAMPEQRDLIVALAAASNVLTYATGLYVGLFIALPLTEKLFALARPNLARKNRGIAQ
ncbi:DUF3100 domain-containing protein [Thalassospira marina]|uniref:DUF3100 domain-containing protein n=1 Tax=Thalassospira marina TaxID=2048283 RepID=A0A2N3KBW2_9PROT|nr:DUF3100 domain-containing protein [Thalassospira marina]PKR48041.1 hypothetical protein COO20_25155 [Thalassospira marina]